MPMWITRASARPSSAASWRLKGSGSASSRSPIGRVRNRSRRSDGRRCSSGSRAATWIPWSTVTRPTGGCAITTATRRMARVASAPIVAVIVYAQRCREAFRDVPIVLGGIESSLRRIAHYDYWSDKVRRSILADAKADILLYGNAERAVVEVAHRLARNGAKATATGASIADLDDIRGVALFKSKVLQGWTELRADDLDAADEGARIGADRAVIRLPGF